MSQLLLRVMLIVQLMSNNRPGKLLQGDQFVDPDVVATIVLHLYAGGQMSIEGNVGDVKLALGMIDGARAAISAKLTPEKGIIVPNYDVPIVHDPQFPVLPAGDKK